MKVYKNCEACGDMISVRLADHQRGWGRFCDKACSAAYKCGQRPKDVNLNHAKYSPWAADRFYFFQEEYWDGTPPKAPSIREQVGRNVKVNKKPRRYGTPISFELDDVIGDYPEMWDEHKEWVR